MTTPLEISIAIGADPRYTLDILSSKPYSMAIVDNNIDSTLRFILTESSSNYYMIQFLYKQEGNTVYEFGYAYRGSTSYVPDIKKFVEWIEKEAQARTMQANELIKVFYATASQGGNKQSNYKSMIDAYPERMFLARMYLDSWRKDNPQQMYMYANGQFNLLDVRKNTPMFERYADGRRFKTYDGAKSQIIKSVYSDMLK